MAASIKDVAALANVGVGTVSRVINGEEAVSEKTREKVLRAIDELGYRSNSMGVMLRRNRSKIIALLVPLIDHPFFAKFAYALETELDKMGYSLLIVSGQRRRERELEALDKLKRREVDGVVFLTHFRHENVEFDDLPIVSVDRHLSGKTPYVTTDNFDASVKAVEYLYSKGCRNIAFLGGCPAVESEVSERVRAYAAAVGKLGISTKIYNPVIVHGEEEKIASEFVKGLGDTDGVFVSGDTLAQALYNACYKGGISVPDRLQIAAFDGALNDWNYGGKLSCVVQPIEKMGQAAARIIVDRINGKPYEVRTVIPSEFIAGNSTKL